MMKRIGNVFLEDQSTRCRCWGIRNSNVARTVLVVLLLAVTTISTACAGDLQSVIHPAGPQSENINRLWWFMFYLCGGVFVLVIVFTMVALNRGLRKSRSAAEPSLVELAPPPAGEQRKRMFVIGATVTTLIILFAFLIDSYLVGRGMTAELSAKQGVTIEVTGHQWWWEARYMNVDASSIFTTANEIHIPVGVPITFSLRSTDVIHSFWVPNLSGKKDLIPGKIATIWLQADKPGVYRGQCAEYCGHQHAHMALWVIAEPLEQFNAWKQNQIQEAISPSDTSRQRGQVVFLTSACVMCHSINGTPAGSNIGPNLTHVASRNTIAAATLQNDRDHLAQWVVDSQQIKPGNRMPPNSLAPEDLQALLDYLQSLK
jgi:cytochrome c oxidase subunit 2